MIELPEVVTLARQMDRELRGKRVSGLVRGNHEHKWVWYNREREEFERLPIGKVVGEVRGEGKWISVALEPGLSLGFGDMGGRVQFHASEGTLPRNYHLLVRFDDGTLLTVAIQGWGFISLHDGGAAPPPGLGEVSPLGDDFTYTRFAAIVDAYENPAKNSVKALLVQRPKIMGIGNGYAQDILFRARLDPRRKVATLGEPDARCLYSGLRDTLALAIERGGRDTERDLYGDPGGYVPLLDKRALGKPCPECGTPIEKVSFLGGACYFCPQCQA